MRNERQAYFALASNTRNGAVCPLRNAERRAAKAAKIMLDDLPFAARLSALVEADQRPGNVW